MLWKECSVMDERLQFVARRCSFTLRLDANRSVDVDVMVRVTSRTSGTHGVLDSSQPPKADGCFL
jgi:hypothetical protein